MARSAPPASCRLQTPDLDAWIESGDNALESHPGPTSCARAHLVPNDAPPYSPCSSPSPPPISRPPIWASCCTSTRPPPHRRAQLWSGTRHLSEGVPSALCRGGESVLRRLFEPLGYAVDASTIPLDTHFPAWGDSRYLAVRLSATTKVKDLLEHLFVLLPVLDDDKHYWVARRGRQALAPRRPVADRPSRSPTDRRALPASPAPGAPSSPTRRPSWPCSTRSEPALTWWALDGAANGLAGDGL